MGRTFESQPALQFTRRLSHHISEDTLKVKPADAGIVRDRRCPGIRSQSTLDEPHHLGPPHYVGRLLIVLIFVHEKIVSEEAVNKVDHYCFVERVEPLIVERDTVLSMSQLLILE